MVWEPRQQHTLNCSEKMPWDIGATTPQPEQMKYWHQKVESMMSFSKRSLFHSLPPSSGPHFMLQQAQHFVSLSGGNSHCSTMQRQTSVMLQRPSSAMMSVVDIEERQQSSFTSAATSGSVKRPMPQP